MNMRRNEHINPHFPRSTHHAGVVSFLPCKPHTWRVRLEISASQQFKIFKGNKFPETLILTHSTPRSMICREHLFAALTSDFPLSMTTFRIGWRNLLFWKVQNPKITWGISNSVLDSMECKTISVNGWLTFTLKIDSWYHMLSCGFRVNVSATKAAHHFKTSKMQDFVELQNFRSFFFFFFPLRSCLLCFTSLRPLLLCPWGLKG